MPTILRIRGYRIGFYQADLVEPPHVHVKKQGAEAKFWLETLAVAEVRDSASMSSTKSAGYSRSIGGLFWRLGTRRSRIVATVQARIRAADGHESLLPVVVPDSDAVRAFAAGLHAAGKPWEGEAFGWQGEYVPEGRERPLGSRLDFTPAEFCLGESGVWFFSLMWEHGATAPPVEFIDESGIVHP